MEVVRGGIGVIDAHADAWRELCARTPRDEPFSRPDWIRTYVEAFAPDAELVLFIAKTGGRVNAVLPLIREVGAIGGLPVRKLRSAGNTHTCRFELVHDRPAGEIVPALWRGLVAETGWDVLELADVPLGGALEALASHAASQGYSVHLTPGLTPPYLDLDGRSATAPDERLDAKFRSNLRRRTRKLEAHGPVRLTHTREADGALGRFYALERAGWKGDEGSAIALDAHTRAFYDAAAKAAEREGYLSLYTLECGGEPAAMFFGLEHGGRYYLLKTAYDENLRDCSPGQLLTLAALKDLAARGCVELDFLGGAMAWKADWRPALRQLADVHVFRGAAGRAAHALRYRLRPALARAVRRMVPA